MDLLAETEEVIRGDDSPEGRFTAAMVHIVSVAENKPPKGRNRQRLAWQEEVEEAYSEGLQALFGCLPDGTAIEREVLARILSLGQGCVRGGMIFQQMGAPLICS
jgi:hypothetical protein